MGTEATIKNCPNLKRENIHNENCDNRYNWRPPEGGEKSGDSKSILKSLLEQARNLTWQEILVQLAKINSISETDKQIYEAINQILKTKFRTEIINLIIKYRDTKEISKEEFLTQIELKTPHFKSFLDDFTKEQLRRVLSPLSRDNCYQAPVYLPSNRPWFLLGLGWAIACILFWIKKRNYNKN